MKVTKIRAGLYGVDAGNGRVFTVEDYNQDGVGWVWRVTEASSFHDPWVGDFSTKREALAVIKTITNSYATH